MSAGPPVRRIDGRYTVENRIGSGGFSTVWRATDDRGGPDIAVKFPKSADETNNTQDEVAARFQQEYDSYSMFENAPLPSSIAKFVTGNRSNPAYIGMEYLSGEELGDILAKSVITPGVEVVRDYGLPVVRALAYLHANESCHLDCKPDNVIVREGSGYPALIDFNTVSRTSEAGGTLFYEDGYKPPEQTPGSRRDDPVGPWSDVYAAGKLLCYLLTGQTQPTSETPPEGISPNDLGASCSKRLAQVVQRATQADYSKRQADARALMDEMLAAFGDPTATATLTDLDTGKQCLVRPGDSVGRITDDDDTLATIRVEDTNRHISPVQLTCEFDDDGWQITDQSVNGTYLNLDGEWVFLLSDEGYRRLSELGHERVSEGRPYSAARVRGNAIVSPVDPSYPLSLEFSTSVDT